jgi:hypothetical protein
MKKKRKFQYGEPELIARHTGKDGYNTEEKKCKLCGCVQISQNWSQHPCVEID